MITSLPKGWKQMTEEQKQEWMAINIGWTEMPTNWGQLTEEQKLDWLELNMEKISDPWDLEAIVLERQRGIPEREIAESFLMI